MKITDEQLSAYLDDALPPEEKAMVDRALVESPELQRELAQLRQLGPLLKEVPTPEPSERFYRRVLEKTKPHPSPWIQWVFPLVGAAAAALVMVFVAGEKKGSFRQSLSASPSLSLPMSESFEAKKSALGSSGIDDEMLQRQSHRKSSTKELEKLKHEEDLALDSPIAQMEIASTGAAKNVASFKGGAAMGGAMESFSRRQFVETGRKKVSADGDRIANRKIAQKLVAPAVTSNLREEAFLPMEWQGDSSGITDRREVVIKDAAAWAKLWVEHQSVMGTSTNAPAVNFSKNMVVGIFLGDRGSSGYTARITKIEEVGKEVVVSYRETPPSSGGMQLTVMTQPYCLRVIPRTNRPIRFKKN